MDINQQIKDDLATYDKRIKEGKITKADVYRIIAKKYGVHFERVRKHHRMLSEANYRPSVTPLSSRAVDTIRGTLTSNIELDYEPKTIEDLETVHNVDTSKFYIRQYWHGRLPNGKIKSTIQCQAIEEDSVENYQAKFTEFLSTYKPQSKTINKVFKKGTKNVAIILPKQDAHYNKLDINGNNDIEHRFQVIEDSINSLLIETAATKNIEEIIYLVGSDELNSEWTGSTTKFTPQQNILSYQDSFEAVCNHEVDTINNLLAYSDIVKVIFVPGNHDQFSAWHIINFLSAYFRNNDRIIFDSTVANTKYYRFKNTAVMFNHGDVIKPKELVHKFPIGFRKEWSECDHSVIISGDKHSELVMDIHGTKFFRVPQLSGAISAWDDKQGYIDDKPEMNAFIISEDNGICNIWKDILKY